jgi:hypothetical protein
MLSNPVPKRQRWRRHASALLGQPHGGPLPPSPSSVAWTKTVNLDAKRVSATLGDCNEPPLYSTSEALLSL